jgi:hypothetical protein
MLVPFMATQAWIRSLNYSIIDDWRQWYSNAQVAGYACTPNYKSMQYDVLIYMRPYIENQVVFFIENHVVIVLVS